MTIAWEKLPHDGHIYFEVKDRQLLEQLQTDQIVRDLTLRKRRKILKDFCRQIGLTIDAYTGDPTLSSIHCIRCKYVLTDSDKERLRAESTYAFGEEMAKRYLQEKANALAGDKRNQHVYVSYWYRSDDEKALTMEVQIGKAHPIQKQLADLPWPKSFTPVKALIEKHGVSASRMGVENGSMCLMTASPILFRGWWVIRLPAGDKQPANIKIRGLRRLRHSQFWSKIERLALTKKARK